MSNNAIDLSRLPAPNLIDSMTFESLLVERKERLIELTPETEREQLVETLQLESEPLVKFLQESAYRELMLRQMQNERARSLMLAYAAGPELDHIGVTYYLTPRLVITPAQPDATPPVVRVDESDTDYLRRILLAHDAFSTAGSRNAYRYFALRADPRIKDAEVVRPLAGLVQAYVLSREGDGEASTELVNIVEQALSADDARPLTDTVLVASASVLRFSVSATIELRGGPDSAVVREQAIAAARIYVDERHALGETIVAGALESRLYAPGVERVTLHSPVADLGGEPSESPYCTGIQVIIND